LTLSDGIRHNFNLTNSKFQIEQVGSKVGAIEKPPGIISFLLWNLSRLQSRWISA